MPVFTYAGPRADTSRTWLRTSTSFQRTFHESTEANRRAYEELVLRDSCSGPKYVFGSAGLNAHVPADRERKDARKNLR